MAHHFHLLFAVDRSMHTLIPITARFPHIGTTIFTVMSRLAAECGAVDGKKEVKMMRHCRAINKTLPKRLPDEQAPGGGPGKTEFRSP